MEEKSQEFKAGDVVYHKANGQRMVVIESNDSSCSCRYQAPNGDLLNGKFYNVELSLRPI